MFATLTGTDWAILIPMFFTSLGTFVVAVIGAFQNKGQATAIADVHTAVNGAAHSLAVSNAATVSTLTETIKAQSQQPQQPNP